MFCASCQQKVLPHRVDVKILKKGWTRLTFWEVASIRSDPDIRKQFLDIIRKLPITIISSRHEESLSRSVRPLRSSNVCQCQISYVHPDVHPCRWNLICHLPEHHISNSLIRGVQSIKCLEFRMHGAKDHWRVHLQRSVSARKGVEVSTYGRYCKIGSLLLHKTPSSLLSECL